MKMKWVFFKNVFFKKMVLYLHMVQNSAGAKGYDNKKSFSHFVVFLECSLCSRDNIWALTDSYPAHSYPACAWYSTVWMYYSLFNHHVDDRFGGFQCFTIKSNDIINNFVYLSFHTHAYFRKNSWQ